MMEDPRTISASLDLIFIAKSVERIGDRSRNIAEFIIYIVEGRDVRHTFLANTESLLDKK
jgi:phosphate transport system protein